MRVSGLRLFLGVFVATVIFLSGARAQQPAGGGVQEKLAMVKQSAAANQQALRHYSWVETTQISLKGEVKSVKQSSCVYGMDGKVQKTPMSAPEPPQQQGGRHGRLKEKIVEKKKDEMSDYMEQVKGLIGQYVPPDPNRMQQAFQAGNVSLVPSPGTIQLVFKNYVEQGDSMTLSVNEATKKISNLNVNSYLGQAKDVVTLSVMFGTLPDGTTYPNQTVVVAQAKQIQIMSTNSDYQKLGE
jgi:hypothetical protein